MKGALRKSQQFRRSAEKKNRKTIRRRSNHNCKQTYIVQTLLQMLRVVKLHHWNTKSYSQHKATDELYERMNEKMDRFAEVYMGKDRKRVISWNEHMHRMYPGGVEKGDFERDRVNREKGDFEQNVHIFREFLINLDRCLDPRRDSDLLNIRDDLLADVNQFLYLYALR